MAKNDSMLAILWMLNSGNKLTARQIAEKLEINIRTVYRYIDALCASGVPIISSSGHEGGYSLLNNFIQAPLCFDIEEQKALLHAAIFAKESGYPFTEVLNKATDKLRLYSNKEQENILNRHMVGFDVINPDTAPEVKAMLDVLEQSVANSCSVEIDYRSRNLEQPQPRVLDPYGIIYWNNKWYTIGLCHLRKEIRSFRIDRITNLKQTYMTFKRPEPFYSKEYFMQKLLPALSGENGTVTLIVEGRAEALDDLCIHWYLGHYLKERTFNQAVFLVNEEVIDTHIPYFLLSYGRSIRIIEPDSLRQKLVSAASELMEYYKG